MLRLAKAGRAEVTTLRLGNIPSFEEGPARRSSRCHATLISARRGRSDIALPTTELSDLPGRAESKVTMHLFDRRSHPSSKEGIERTAFNLSSTVKFIVVPQIHFSDSTHYLAANSISRLTP